MAKKILVVDDEEEYRALLTRVLARAGYAVAAASNGAQALALYAEGEPDLVLLDVMLPDAIGFELGKKLRASGRPKTPILFCSVRSAASSLAEGLRAGSADYVLKPFDPEDLLARVRAALRAERG